MLKRALYKSTNIGEIILVARACLQQETESIFKEIPAKAAKLPGNATSLITLAKILHKQGESTQVKATLLRAVQKSSEMLLLQNVTLAIIEVKQGPLIDKVRARVIYLSSDLNVLNPNEKKFKEAYAWCLQFVDFLFKVDRPEDAAKLFEDIESKIKKGRRIDEQYISLMLDISRDAIRRDLKKQASSIVFKLSASLKKPRNIAFFTYLKLQEGFLESMRGLPDQELVSIALYNGLIDEDINKLNKAEEKYMQAVLFSLDTVNNSYGDKLPATVN